MVIRKNVQGDIEDYECNDCGAKLSIDDKFCPKCGVDVSEFVEDEEKKQKEWFMDNKNFFTFFHPILDSLNKGSLIRNVMAFLFRLIGVAIFIGGVYFFFKAISYASDLWYVILLLLFLVFSFISLQIWFYRANKILELEDSDFTTIPIFSNLFRALGENYAVFLVTIGLCGTLMLWFSNYVYDLWKFVEYIPFVSLTASFVGGLIFLLWTIAIAFFVLLFTYFLAENILVLVEIAKNTRGLKKENNMEE